MLLSRKYCGNKKQQAPARISWTFAGVLQHLFWVLKMGIEWEMKNELLCWRRDIFWPLLLSLNLEIDSQSAPVSGNQSACDEEADTVLSLNSDKRQEEKAKECM
jgi:hypothetical protein